MSQVVGTGLTDPASHVYASPHGKHAAAPVAFWWVPLGHSMHSVLRVLFAYVPLLHFRGVTRPPAHQLPIGHGSQLDWSLNARPSSGRYVPSSHEAGIRALEPGGHW